MSFGVILKGLGLLGFVFGFLSLLMQVSRKEQGSAAAWAWPALLAFVGLGLVVVGDLQLGESGRGPKRAEVAATGVAADTEKPRLATPEGRATGSEAVDAEGAQAGAGEAAEGVAPTGENGVGVAVARGSAVTRL